MRMVLRFLVPVVMCLGCASGTAPKVDSPEVVRELERLRAPFQTERTIVADRVEIEMSANFYGTEWGAPSIDRSLHEFSSKKEANRDEYRWTNRAGGPQVPLRFMVGKQRFVVLRSASLHVLGGGQAVVFGVTAAGAVSILEGTARRDVAEFRIEDGVLRAR